MTLFTSVEIYLNFFEKGSISQTELLNKKIAQGLPPNTTDKKVHAY